MKDSNNIRISKGNFSSETYGIMMIFPKRWLVFKKEALKMSLRYNNIQISEIKHLGMKLERIECLFGYDRTSCLSGFIIIDFCLLVKDLCKEI